MRAWITLCEAQSFAAWFGDSVVVDKDHKPLQVYHGTAANFQKFERRRSIPLAEIGFWFAASAQVAQLVAWRKGNDTRVITAYLRLEHPFVLAESGVDGLTLLVRTVAPRGEVTREAVATFRHHLIEQGHDGIILRDVMADGGRTDNYVVFSPDQIHVLKPEQHPELAPK
jgi:hypothetical protein